MRLCSSLRNGDCICSEIVGTFQSTFPGSFGINAKGTIGAAWQEWN